MRGFIHVLVLIFASTLASDSQEFGQLVASVKANFTLDPDLIQIVDAYFGGPGEDMAGEHEIDEKHMGEKTKWDFIAEEENDKIETLKEIEDSQLKTKREILIDSKPIEIDLNSFEPWETGRMEVETKDYKLWTYGFMLWDVDELPVILFMGFYEKKEYRYEDFHFIPIYIEDYDTERWHQEYLILKRGETAVKSLKSMWQKHSGRWKEALGESMINFHEINQKIESVETNFINNLDQNALQKADALLNCWDGICNEQKKFNKIHDKFKSTLEEEYCQHKDDFDQPDIEITTSIWHDRCFANKAVCSFLIDILNKEFFPEEIQSLKELVNNGWKVSLNQNGTPCVCHPDFQNVYSDLQIISQRYLCGTAEKIFRDFLQNKIKELRLKEVSCLARQIQKSGLCKCELRAPKGTGGSHYSFFLQRGNQHATITIPVQSGKHVNKEYVKEIYYLFKKFDILYDFEMNEKKTMEEEVKKRDLKIKWGEKTIIRRKEAAKVYEIVTKAKVLNIAKEIINGQAQMATPWRDELCERLNNIHQGKNAIFQEIQDFNTQSKAVMETTSQKMTNMKGKCLLKLIELKKHVDNLQKENHQFEKKKMQKQWESRDKEIIMLSIKQLMLNEGSNQMSVMKKKDMKNPGIKVIKVKRSNRK